MAVDRLKHFLDVSALAPPEHDGRHFRTWQRVSVQVQREVRALAATNFLVNEVGVASNLDLAFTMVVYSSCHPCRGRRPMDFTYDIGDLAGALRLIGRSLQGRLAKVSFQDPRLKRRFSPVWHVDILNSVKQKPRLLRELLAREGTMINGLIDLGTTRDAKTAKRFLKSTMAAARVLGDDSEPLLTW